MRKSLTAFLWLAIAAICANPASAAASLGGDLSSVTTDQVRVQGALMRIAPAGPYTVHEIRSASGVMIREFVSSVGSVFAVAWEGPYQPDLSQILGAYYARFQQQAERSQRSGKRRGSVLIEDADFVVQMSGHQRSFTGRAYLPRALPQGVSVQAIR